MAGGKETPRQKMIGMMYLVLTALLALNVSNAVLEKFAILDTTLGELRMDEEGANVSKNRTIQDSGSKSPQVIDAKKRALEVRDLTQKTIARLDDFKVKLRQDHEGKEMESEELILNTNIAEEKMLNANNPQLGEDFEKLLVNYVDSLKTITRISSFKKLNKKAEDYDEFRNNEHHKEKDFLHFTFEGTPTMAAITVISQLQTEVLEYEATALDSLAKIADAVQLKVDTYVPMVIPEAATVAAGAKYKAKMFVAASASGIIPTMKRNGQQLSVIDDPETKLKVASFEFVASASNYGPGDVSKQSYNAEITLKLGKDTTIRRSIEYFVVKPTIKVTTGNAPTLYMNCGNSVNIDVPSLGTNYNPTYAAKGAVVVAGPKASQPVIIPKEKKVFLTVSSGGATLGTEPFDVKPIPKPSFVVKNALGKDVDRRNGEKSGNLANLRVNAEPEPNFKQEVPKDAVYRIKEVLVTLARGTSPQGGGPKTFTSENIDISAWRSVMRPGDIISIDIRKVTRRTFEGQEEPVNIRDEIIKFVVQ
ncbi:MAG: gliding motility protein GldM [Bacteroidetes bacterium]|nr:gliding motility protein GldM [Bacteroidota bacterium]